MVEREIVKKGVYELREIFREEKYQEGSNLGGFLRSKGDCKKFCLRNRGDFERSASNRLEVDGDDCGFGWFGIAGAKSRNSF